MAEDLIEKISLEDTVYEIDTDSEENGDEVKDEQGMIFIDFTNIFPECYYKEYFILTSVN